MPNQVSDVASGIVIAAGQSGHVVVPADTPLTRLNYFDGKFLRADDLRDEQTYVRHLAWLAAQTGGEGIVYGLELALGTGDALLLSAGFALDANGRPLLVPGGTTISVAIETLIQETARRLPPVLQPLSIGSADFQDCVVVSETPVTNAPQGARLYLVTLGAAEALCGNENVYGRICDSGCATTTARPYALEGIVLRAIPLVLRTPLAQSTAVPLTRRHLRSLVASAFYGDERQRGGSLISRAGLLSNSWCGGAQLALGLNPPPGAGADVALGVLARDGTSTVFLDLWTARRERVDTPPRRYWAWRMAMRPWDVYLAQILQFQCQLASLLRGDVPGVGPDDPCRETNDMLADASRYLTEVERHYRQLLDQPALAATAATLASSAAATAASAPSVFVLPGGAARLATLNAQLAASLRVVGQLPRTRVLIAGGIVELPPAGYLPVVAPSPTSVNDQVRALLGEGLDLRFCVVRPDFVAHALEEAQHMDRISLLDGLDHPDAKPAMDVLVPDGTIVTPQTKPPGRGFETSVNLRAPRALQPGNESVVPPVPPVPIRGAGRAERLPAGGAAFHFAGAQELLQLRPIVDLVATVAALRDATATDRATIFDRFPRATGGTGAPEPTALDPALAARLASRSAGARIALELPQLEVIGTPAAAPAPAPAPAPTRQPPPTASLWLTMRCERDPLTLRPADLTPASIEAILAAGDDKRTLLQLRLFGTLRISQAAIATPSGRSVTGHFSGAHVLRAISENNAQPDQSLPAEADISLVVQGSADDGTVTLRFGRPGSYGYSLVLRWSGTPLTAEASLAMQYGRTIATPELGPASAATLAPAAEALATEVLRLPYVQIATAHLVDSADVLRAGNDSHTIAVSALELIGRALAGAGQNGAGFTDAAEQALFPPAPPPPESPVIQATHDWVLFHRRRDKQCAVPVSRPAPAPARRYQLYQLRVDSPAQLAAVRDALRTPQGITAFKYARVDVVEYVGGMAALVSNPDLVRADWNATQPGNTLLYGAVFTPLTTDPPPLAAARLGRLVDALSSVTPVDPTDVGVRFEALPSVPPALAMPGTDGVIFLVTRRVVSTVCHSVYRVDPSTTGDFARLADEGAFDQLVARLDDRKLTTLVGTAEFHADGTDITSDAAALARQWTQLGDGKPGRVLTLSRRGDTAAGSDAQRLARAAAIAGALGATSAIRNDVDPVSVALPTSCRSATIVAPMLQTTCHLVLAVASGTDADRLVQAGNVAALLQASSGGSLAVLNAPTVWRVGEADFEGPFANLTTESANALVQRWQQITSGMKVSGAIVFQQPNAPAAADATLAEARAQAIARTLTGITNVAASAHLATSAWPAIPCPALTVLVLEPQTTCQTVYRAVPAGRVTAAGPNDQQTTALIDALRDPQASPAPPVVVGTATFETTGSDLTGANTLAALAQGWDAAGDCPPGYALVISHGDAAAGTTALRAARAASIASALGGTLRGQRSIDLPATTTLPGSCPAITVLLPRTTINFVAALFPRDGKSFSDIETLLKAGDLASLGPLSTILGIGWFRPGTDQVARKDVIATLQQLSARIQRPLVPKQLHVLAVDATIDADVEPQAVQQAQAVALADLVGVAPLTATLDRVAPVGGTVPPALAAAMAMVFVLCNFD